MQLGSIIVSNKMLSKKRNVLVLTSLLSQPIEVDNQEKVEVVKEQDVVQSNQNEEGMSK